MKYQILSVQVLVESVDKDDTCTIVRDALQQFRCDPESKIVDWRFMHYPEPHDGKGFDTEKPTCAE